MIVVQTRALYESEPCNDEIRVAGEHNLVIIPLLFEPDAIAPFKEQWATVQEKYERRGDQKSAEKLHARSRMVF